MLGSFDRSAEERYRNQSESKGIPSARLITMCYVEGGHRFSDINNKPICYPGVHDYFALCNSCSLSKQPIYELGIQIARRQLGDQTISQPHPTAATSLTAWLEGNIACLRSHNARTWNPNGLRHACHTQSGHYACSSFALWPPPLRHSPITKATVLNQSSP